MCCPTRRPIVCPGRVCVWNLDVLNINSLELDGVGLSVVVPDTSVALRQTDIGNAAVIPPRSHLLGRSYLQLLAEIVISALWRRILKIRTGQFEIRSATSCKTKFRTLATAVRPVRVCLERKEDEAPFRSSTDRWDRQ